ncbi:MAG: Asp23/Gls24 family envelope stress response protein [Erysipelotrichales bacterium]|nr:Asp23/Gls24 family envelope stress response protein [Erysipelotrichales bacterium]MBR3693594.1 Asp23/Gls24 family envelope stress response protein [Erysipelotrichales bacterium]
MAQEYFAINTSSKTGIFALTTGVFETIAEIAISESDAAVLGETAPFRRSVTCKLSEDKMVISAEVKVKYGLNVTAVCEDLQQRIYSAILHMSDIKADAVEIKVIGFVF